jgi:hypothetical protein
VTQPAKQPGSARAHAARGRATATRLSIIPCGAMHADLAWLLLKPGVTLHPPWSAEQERFGRVV